MDFSFTEEEQEVSDLARKILEDQVTHEKLTALESSGEARFDRELWAQLAKANLLGIGLPEAVGGSGLGLLAQSLVLEQIGRTLAPVPYLATIAMAADVVAAHGTAAQID
ncbi:MAG: acyl-CoA dehydrogenase family protein, partial [Ilumatobacteraceae bacterium]